MKSATEILFGMFTIGTCLVAVAFMLTLAAAHMGLSLTLPVGS